MEAGVIPEGLTARAAACFWVFLTLGTAAFFCLEAGTLRLAAFLPGAFREVLALETGLRLATAFLVVTFLVVAFFEDFDDLVAGLVVFLPFFFAATAFSTRERAGLALTARLFSVDLEELRDPGRVVDRLSPFVTWLLIRVLESW